MSREVHVRFCERAEVKSLCATHLICRCKSAEEARALWSAIADRFAVCKLALHPQKTKIVYCKDANRPGDHPNQSFDFLGFNFRARKALGRGRYPFACFLPAASPKALTRISREIRRWAFHHRNNKSLQDLAAIYNPCIRGWVLYYSHFYKTQLRPTLKRIDVYVIRWARTEVQATAPPDQGGKRLVRPASPLQPDALRPLAAMPWQRSNIGSRVTREGHARFWERPRVKVRQATRHFHHCPSVGFWSASAVSQRVEGEKVPDPDIRRWLIPFCLG